MGVVDQSVEDAIGQRRFADLLVPAGDWQLRSEDGRAHLVAAPPYLPCSQPMGPGLGKEPS
jgi:hypothetical protein